MKTIIKNIYHVCSPSSEEPVHEVQLDAGDGFPRCQCKDWQTFNYPCKHILAIIASDLHPAVTWDSLPEQYRNNPFITLHISMVVSTVRQDQDKPEIPSINDSVKDKTVMVSGIICMGHVFPLVRLVMETSISVVESFSEGEEPLCIFLPDPCHFPYGCWSVKTFFIFFFLFTAILNLKIFFYFFDWGVRIFNISIVSHICMITEVQYSIAVCNL